MPDTDITEPEKQSFNPVDWLWARLSQNRLGRILILIFALVTVVSSFGQAVEKFPGWIESARDYFDQAKSPSEPVVLFIYPNREFGLLRRNGFERGVKTFEGKPIFHDKYLASSFDKLKSGDISEIKAELISRLKNDTVVAVVAPSITEATRPVIELVHEHNHAIPIVLKSSIDPSDLQWRQDSHLFRLSSGVDTRGIELGRVISSLVKSGRPVAIIVEDEPNSYGGKMLQYAGKAAPAEVDSVPIFRYTPGSLKTTLDTLFQNKTNFDQLLDEAIKRLKDPAAVVFFLGVGSDLEPLLNASFRKASLFPARAKIVGIMNAYKLADLYRTEQNPIRSDLIFEITDFDFILPINPPAEVVAFEQIILGPKPLTPVLRDQAYSYDEATLLSDAIASAAKARSYNHGLSLMNKFLYNYSGRGVTGSIVLSGGKASSSAVPVRAGQNVGSTMRLVVYQQDSGTWSTVSTSAL